jgi:hypothetical protein
MGARMGDQKFLRSSWPSTSTRCIGTIAFLSFVCAGEIVTTHLYCATAAGFLYCCVN